MGTTINKLAAFIKLWIRDSCTGNVSACSENDRFFHIGFPHIAKGLKHGQKSPGFAFVVIFLRNSIGLVHRKWAVLVNQSKFGTCDDYAQCGFGVYDSFIHKVLKENNINSLISYSQDGRRGTWSAPVCSGNRSVKKWLSGNILLLSATQVDFQSIFYHFNSSRWRNLFICYQKLATFQG